MKLSQKYVWTRTTRFLDLFLPKSNRNSNQGPPYLAVGALLLSFVVLSLNILSFTQSQDRPLAILQASLLLLFYIGGCLVALKAGVKQQIVTGSFHMFMTTAITVLQAYYGGSFYAPGLFFFMVSILHASLFSSTRLALFQSLYVIAGTLFVFWKTNDYGYQLPFHWTFDDFVVRLRMVIILVCLTTYLAMMLHDYLRKSAEQALAGEREWLLRSSRLQEVSILAESLSFQIYSPLREFGREFSRLKGALGSESFETLEIERVQAMDRSVEELIQISRSFDWIYRSHKHDFLSGASIETVLRRLRILLEGKALENGWALRFQCDHPDQQIMGDIPSLMLLFVTLAHRNFDRYASSPTMALDLRAVISETGEGPVAWYMSWPKTAEKNAFFSYDSPKDTLSQLVDEIRESLVEELRRDCHATLEQYATKAHFEICIRFPQSV